MRFLFHERMLGKLLMFANGAATIDSYGQLLYATGLGHGDAFHFGKSIRTARASRST